MTHALNWPEAAVAIAMFAFFAFVIWFFGRNDD
jgi:hypothetical protein